MNGFWVSWCFSGPVYSLRLAELTSTTRGTAISPREGRRRSPPWTPFLSPDGLLSHAPPGRSLEAADSTGFVRFAADCGLSPSVFFSLSIQWRWSHQRDPCLFTSPASARPEHSHGGGSPGSREPGPRCLPAPCRPQPSYRPRNPCPALAFRHTTHRPQAAGGPADPAARTLAGGRPRATARERRGTRSPTFWMQPSWDDTSASANMC